MSQFLHSSFVHYKNIKKNKIWNYVPETIFKKIAFLNCFTSKYGKMLCFFFVCCKRVLTRGCEGKGERVERVIVWSVQRVQLSRSLHVSASFPLRSLIVSLSSTPKLACLMKSHLIMMMIESTPWISRKTDFGVLIFCWGCKCGCKFVIFAQMDHR